MHPGVSVLFSYYPAARSEVECRACTREMHRLHLSTSPFLSFPFSYEHSCLSPCTRFFVHLYVQLFPSSGTQLPLGYDFFSLPLSLSLFLSRHLFLRFSTGLFPLSVARLVELFFVCRASPLYRCYAPTTASGVPTGERVTTFAPNIRLLVHEAFVIHRSLLRIAWHSELRASHAHRVVRLRFARASTRDPGREQDETFRNKHPGTAPRRKASGPIDARKCSGISSRSTDNFYTVIERDFGGNATAME